MWIQNDIGAGIFTFLIFCTIMYACAGYGGVTLGSGSGSSHSRSHSTSSERDSDHNSSSDDEDERRRRE